MLSSISGACASSTTRARSRPSTWPMTSPEGLSTPATRFRSGTARSLSWRDSQESIRPSSSSICRRSSRRRRSSLPTARAPRSSARGRAAWRLCSGSSPSLSSGATASAGSSSLPSRAGLGAFPAPAGLFFVWLAQFVGDAAAQRHPVRFTQQVETVGSGLRLRPEQIAWGGGVKVAALVAVPLAVLAVRRRWSAYVLGGTLAIALAALVPPVFEHLADTVSLSQAVRLASLLPPPFALSGAAGLAGPL